MSRSNTAGPTGATTSLQRLRPIWCAVRSPSSLPAATSRALAVKKTTATIPIVFTSGADPVESGLVASLSRPEGNLTGVSLLAVEMATKRLELIRDLLPQARAVAMIVNPDYSGAESEMADVEAAGRTIGIKAHKLTARSAPDIDTAFEAIGGLQR